MVSTLDSESSDPSSNLGRTCLFFLCLFAFVCQAIFSFEMLCCCCFAWVAQNSVQAVIAQLGER
jgi:hypothetical protein